MSWAAMDSVYELDIDDALAKFILVTIAKHVDAKMQGFPSVDRICKLTGLGRSTVHRKIKYLVDAGHLIKSRRFMGSKQTSNLYTIRAITKRKKKLVNRGVTETPVGSQRETTGVSEGDPNISDNKSSNISLQKNEVDWSSVTDKLLEQDKKWITI